MSCRYITKNTRMRKIKVFTSIRERGLPTARFAIELFSPHTPKGMSLGEAISYAFDANLGAVNLRTEALPGSRVSTGFFRLKLDEHTQSSAYIALLDKYNEFFDRGLMIALMESTLVDHWNAIAGITVRFGRLAMVGEVCLVPGLTHREAMTSGRHPVVQMDHWHCSDRARLYYTLRDHGELGTFYEVACVDDRRFIFYDVSRDTTNAHASQGLFRSA